MISKSQINILEVIFDSKLQWNAQIESAIKWNKAKYAISLIFKYFNKNELINLLTYQIITQSFIIILIFGLSR